MILDLSAIRSDGGTQSRDAIDTDVVDAYAEAARGGATFPPIVVFFDGAHHWLADGFHRVEVKRKSGASGIVADVRQGTRRDAVLYSVGANATHGKPRTNADKRRAVTLLLGDEEWCSWNASKIARTCAVSEPFVLKMKAESSNGLNSRPKVLVEMSNGTVFERATRSAPIARQTSLAVALEPEPDPADDDGPVADFRTSRPRAKDGASSFVNGLGETVRLSPPGSGVPATFEKPSTVSQHKEEKIPSLVHQTLREFCGWLSEQPSHVKVFVKASIAAT